MLGELLLGYFLFDVFLWGKRGGDAGEFSFLPLEEKIIASHIAPHPCVDYYRGSLFLFK